MKRELLVGGLFALLGWVCHRLSKSQAGRTAATSVEVSRWEDEGGATPGDPATTADAAVKANPI